MLWFIEIFNLKFLSNIKVKSIFHLDICKSHFQYDELYLPSQGVFSLTLAPGDGRVNLMCAVSLTTLAQGSMTMWIVNVNTCPAMESLLQLEIRILLVMWTGSMLPASY